MELQHGTFLVFFDESCLTSFVDGLKTLPDEVEQSKLTSFKSKADLSDFILKGLLISSGCSVSVISDQGESHGTTQKWLDGKKNIQIKPVAAGTFDVSFEQDGQSKTVKVGSVIGVENVIKMFGENTHFIMDEKVA